MDIASATQLRDNVLKNNSIESSRKLESFKSTLAEDADMKAHKRVKLEEVAQGFEQIFLNMMFTSMRDTLDKKSDVLYGGFSQEIFEDMLYEKHAENIAANNFLGFSNMIVDQYEKYL